MEQQQKKIISDVTNSQPSKESTSSSNGNGTNDGYWLEEGRTKVLKPRANTGTSIAATLFPFNPFTTSLSMSSPASETCAGSRHSEQHEDEDDVHHAWLNLCVFLAAFASSSRRSGLVGNVSKSKQILPSDSSSSKREIQLPMLLLLDMAGCDWFYADRAAESLFH